MPSGTTTATTTAAATRCTATGTPSATIAAPPSAPATVPTLNPAWKRGMIATPRRCSTAAPSTFMATSQVPLPKPMRKRPTTTGGIPAGYPSATTASPTATQQAITVTVRAVPSRVTTTPASGSATREPRATASSTSPSVDGDACSASRSCGMREAQVAKPNPAPMKAT